LQKIRESQAEDQQLVGLIRSHDSVPELKTKAKYLDAGQPYLCNLFYSGVARLIFLQLSGVPEQQALIEVLDGYRRLMVEGAQECMVGATFALDGVPPEGVNLGQDTTLRCLSGEEHRHVGGRNPFHSRPRPGEQDWLKPHSPAIIIGHELRTIEIYVDSVPKIASRFRQQVRACMAFLQLEVDGRIRPRRIFLFDVHWLPSILGYADRLSECIELVPDRGFGVGDGVTPLDPAKVAILKERWPKYQAAMKNSRFHLACSRYSLSLERDTEEDRIIDHWIAMESLFTKQDAEIGSLAAAKMAILLGGNLRVRNTMRKAIKSHYAVRSALVHGGRDLDKRFQKFCQFWEKDAPVREFNRHFTALQSQEWLEHLLKLLVSEPQAIDEIDDVLLSADPKFRTRKPGYWPAKITEARQNDTTEAAEQ
jgi:hypothetical protein